MSRDLASCPRAPSQAGFAMVMALFVVLLVSGLSIGLLHEGMAGRVSLDTHRSNLCALELVEAGLVRAETELRSETDLDGGGLGSVAGLFAQGTYAVRAVPHPTFGNRWVLYAVGEYRNSRRRVEVGVRRRSGSLFADALFSDEDLPLSSVVTDAYDSATGTYASQAVNSDAAGTYAQPGGGMGSNRNLVLGGTSVWVRGDAVPGPDHEVVLSGSPTVTGDMLPRTYELSMAPPPEADFQAALDDNSNESGLKAPGQGNSVRYNRSNYTLDVAGNASVTMQSGTYFFRDVNIRGGATVTVKGPVSIYVTGTLEFGAGANILAASAADVRIYVHPYVLPAGSSSTGGSAEVKVSGGSNVTWALYGPGATLDIGGGNHFYGAAVGKHIELNGNNAFHYDSALGRDETRRVGQIERLYWKEIGPPRR